MRIFVAWDMARNARLKLLVERVQRKHADKYTLDVLGFPGRELFGDVWEDQAGRRILEADRLLALVDAPNVNVGFEIGYALGKGRPVALVRSVPEVPAWLGHEPLTSQLVRQATTIDTLLDVLASEDWASTPAPPPPAGQVLLLAPGDDCSAQRDELLDLPLAWATVPPGAPVRTGLGDLPRLLAGVGRVAWVVPPSPTTPPADDPASAAAAVTAGYALATGREVRLFRHVLARPVADHARHAHAYDSLDDLVDKVRTWLTPAVGPADPVEAWRARVIGELSRATPFHTRLTGMELERVCVKVGVEARDPERLHDPRGASLGAFLESTAHRAWFVAADPGAGKTTAARRLALELARTPDGPLPVYLPLPDVADRLDGALDPVDVVWRLAARAFEDKDREPLVATLRSAGERGAVLLFDGLDEVPPRRMAGVLATLARLPGVLPGAKVVVLTRSVMVERHPAPEPFRVATLLKLEPEQARELVRNLAGADEPRVTRALQERPTLADLARNPLMLTLVTLVALDAMERGADLPVRRAEVYGAAVDYLLRRGHQGQGDTRGVKEPILAARLLAPMAFALTRQDGVTWAPSVLHDAVTEGRRALGEADAWLFKETWETNGAFLEDLSQNAGICAPEHGPGSVWRFLHNTLREYLAAVELNGRGEEAVEVFEGEWTVAAQRWEEAARAERVPPADRPAPVDPARWGEVHALYCGITPSPSRALTRLRARSPAIFARALPQADVSAKVAVGMLAEPGLWSGEHGWMDECVLALVAVHGADAARPLLDLLTPQSSTLQIGLTAWAMETIQRFDPDEVFGRARPGVTPPTIDAVPIPAGSFWMGHPDGVGHGDERPRHRVTLTRPFRLGRTTVRADEWHVFSGGDQPRKARLPAVGMSWYEAWAFARWVGGELPTEAEWEFACRAGTDTRWSHGDDETKLGEYAWFKKNAGGAVHAVATRKANPWGPYDMHGNVWEWCADDWRDYSADAVTDPVGAAPPLGAPGWRASRGGTCWNDADKCRSAFRSRNHPWNRNGGLGFRVRLPPP